ncbi:calmodulin-like protein [Actinidia rufa]|uniref:Calmodulin-like protein n=1 Tax=Actinidia rufa TaxID=165716 RepID=A0A7J0E3Y6_9ERIC|nr:calmodulin-like protein [Actinidia rufa]
MPEADPSDSDSQGNESNSSSEELETLTNGGDQKMTDYERQRMKRIEENRERMEALGLKTMASSLMGSAQSTKKKKSESKGKAKMVEEDEEYRPREGEEGSSSSSEEDEDDEDFSGSRRSKVISLSLSLFSMYLSVADILKLKVNKKYSTPKKKVSVQKLMSNSDFVDDDEALMQAIALSLKDSAECPDVGCSGIPQSSDAHLTDGLINERKGNARIQEDTGKRKRKRMVASRVRMTEDELVVHFFQFDEAGKGSITLRDLKRVAAAHDFTWTDKEIADMIYCFDTDGDGKLSLDEFRKIVGQCNMIQVSEKSVLGSKA